LYLRKKNRDMYVVEKPPKLPVSLLRLLALLDEGGEDDHGRIGPTQFAFKTAFLMIAEAICMADGETPDSSPSVDSQGGIRVTWRRDDKTVKLVCPSTKDGPLYIYHSSTAGNSLRNQNVTPLVLAERLSWLTASEPAATQPTRG
jgi:hypothetical protein